MISVWIVVGVIGEWLAGRMARGNGAGTIGDIVAGMIGVFVFHEAGAEFGTGIGGSLVVACIGAAIAVIVLHQVMGVRSGRKS